MFTLTIELTPSKAKRNAIAPNKTDASGAITPTLSVNENIIASAENS